MSCPVQRMNAEASELKERSLHEIWWEDGADLRNDAEAVWRFAKRVVGAGENFLALEIAESVLTDPAIKVLSVPLLHQKARALIALGSTDEARRTLESAPMGGPGDPETLGLLGRICKDLAAAAPEVSERNGLLAEAGQYYELGFERALELSDREGAEYCGINVASMAVLLDDRDGAERMAEETKKYSLSDDSFYSLATRAEIALILKNEEEARALYRRVIEVTEREGHWGNLASIRRQCRAVALKVYGRRDAFDDCFPVRSVAVFAGGMADPASCETPRFPVSAESSVRDRIVSWLDAESVRWSFSSASCGSDVIFLEAAQSIGVKTHIILPLRVDLFIESYLRPAGQDWVDRFLRVLDRAASKTILNEQVAEDKSSVFDFSNRMIAARAALHATGLNASKKALAVWDRHSEGVPGGVADAVQVWCRAKIPVHVIHPADPAGDGPVSGVISEEIAERAIPFDRITTALSSGSRARVCAVLHLYFAGYYSLREDQYEVFCRTALGAIAGVVASTSYPPVSRNGLGADYVFVFESERVAGVFAKELLPAIAGALSLAPEFDFELPRAILHSGPAQLMVNPVLNQYSYEGVTLTRPGRVARHVAPGAIYCTETFASLAALEASREMIFEYAGTSKYEESKQEDRLYRIRFQ